MRKNGKNLTALLLCLLLCTTALMSTACGGDPQAGGENSSAASQRGDSNGPQTNPDAIPAIAGMGEYMASKAAGSIPVNSINAAYAAYMFRDRDVFENATVDHIDVIVNRVAAMDENQYMTVFLADAHTAELIQEFKFYARAEELDSVAPKKVVSLYCNEPVIVGSGETLMFGQQGDPILWGYVQHDNAADDSLKGFYMQSTVSNGNQSSILCVDVYLTGKVVEEKVDPQVKALLTGKKLSVMGDSISTFAGWSNSTQVNSSLGDNALYYPNGVLTDVDATWWKQTADICGMEILVNNAWAGSTVAPKSGEASAGWNTRPDNLHDNTPDNNPGGQSIDPDVIAVYLGINDSGNGVFCDTGFDEQFWAKVEAEDYVPQNMDDSYAVMIRKIRKNYPDAVVFCFTLPESKSGAGTMLAPFNMAIRAVAEHFGCQIVDLNATPLSMYYPLYTSDNLHPTPEGMAIMAETFIDALEAYYGK